MSTDSIAEQLERAAIIAIIRSPDPGDLLAAAHAMRRGGITAMEVTLNTPGALDAISRITAELPDSMLVGAGTILRAEDAVAAISAGARFIVTPTLQPDTIRLCRQRSVPVCCGCFSPTEMLEAHRL